MKAATYFKMATDSQNLQSLPSSDQLTKSWSICKLTFYSGIFMLIAGIGLYMLLINTTLGVHIADKLRLNYYPNYHCDGCNNFNYSYNGAIPNCADSDEVFLLVLVTSYHADVHLRDIIRSTWGGVKEYNNRTIQTVFVLGTHSDDNLKAQIVKEQELYGDVIQADFVEHYQAGPNKSMAGLNWAITYCPGAKYILKTTANDFNIPQRYVDYLIHIDVPTLVGGFCFSPETFTFSKHTLNISMDIYPEKYYPVYCHGSGYILSHFAAREIVQVSRDVRFVVKEDAFVTGMCRYVAKLHYTQIPGMHFRVQELTSCNVASYVKNCRGVAPDAMAPLWDKVKVAEGSCNERSYSWWMVLFVLFFILWGFLVNMLGDFDDDHDDINIK